MTGERKPRYKRVSGGTLRLTDRDVEIVRAVARHRLLASTHIESLVGGSAQQLRRRLQALFHARYLDRPPIQKSDVYTPGSSPMVYALGNKGADLLAERDGLLRGAINWSAKNKGLGERFMHHTLLVSSVMAAFEGRARAHGGVRVVHFEEILAEKCPPPTRKLAKPKTWQVTLPGIGKTGITPDAIFGLEFANRPEGKNTAYFFLEADRATMPVVRSNLAQTSIVKKLKLYHTTYVSRQHTAHFGFRHFRVLFVTTDTERVPTMVAAARGLPGLQGLFLFADTSVLERDVLGEQWLNGRGEMVGVG